MAALLIALNDFIKTAPEAAPDKKKLKKTIIVMWVMNGNPRRSTVSKNPVLFS